MSYLGRITGRLAPAGAAARPALTPSGRLASPIARRDQRLHALGTDSAWSAAAPGAALHGIDAADGDAAITGIDGEPIDFAFAGPTAGAGPRAGTPAVSTGPRAALAVRSDATGARPAAPAVADVGARRGPAPSAIERAAPPGLRGSGSTVPSAAASGPAPVAAPGDRSPFEARDGGQRPASRPGVGAGMTEATREPGPDRIELVADAGVPRPAPAAADPFAAALADVMGKVHRWMASEPRPGAAGRTAERAPNGTGAGAPPSARAARAAGRSGPALAPSLFQTPGATPRLTVGQINVQVLPPPATPVVAAAPPRAPRAAASASAAGEASLPAYLTFGLRQR